MSSQARENNGACRQRGSDSIGEISDKAWGVDIEPAQDPLPTPGSTRL
jgi:hypothetical protein